MTRKLLFALMPACCPMLPTARETTPPTGAEAETRNAWASLNTHGKPPTVIFVTPDCDRGMQDYNGLGCVGGEYINNRVYIARIAAWKQVLRHELLHVAEHSSDHTSTRWYRCGDGWCAK